jgi:hypothetical protein
MMRGVPLPPRRRSSWTEYQPDKINRRANSHRP